MKWFNISDIQIDYDREYIAKWKKQFVNNGRFRKNDHGITFHFESGRYVCEENFGNLYILLVEDDNSILDG